MADACQHEAVLTEVGDVLSPDHTALIVVDVQNDFVHHDGVLATKIGPDMSHVDAALPRINEAIRVARAAGAHVVYLKEVISAGTLLPNFTSLFGGIDDVAVRDGTWGAEFLDDLEQPLPHEPVIQKPCYDGFQDTSLDVTLRSLGVRSCVYSGCATNVCVEATARHGFVQGYYTALLDDACGALSQEDHEATLNTFKVFYGPVLRVSELADLWKVASEVATAQ